MARLLYYLYGPGKANEHTDPHLVAGFDDPKHLEPEHRPDGSRDFRRLAGLLNQPLAALNRPGYDKPVWHCSVRAAPADRILSDAEWAEVAAEIMHRTGLARRGDDAGVRWVAVRHAGDHIHIVATLARQDGVRPGIWNDFYRVREACRAAEQKYGLTPTAAGDRTAAKRPTRAETEQAARHGWDEAPRVALRRHVCAAAAGASTECEFFTALEDAGVLVRQRYSTIRPGQVTGYAVGLPHHRNRSGATVWYGGGKLAADLTLPKLRRRWAGGGGARAKWPGQSLSAPAMRAVLRNAVTAAAEQAPGELEFFALLRESGLQVRLRFSEIHPGQVNGYAVTLPGHHDGQNQPLWFSGGRLADWLTLPRLRRRWGTPAPTSAERSGAATARAGAFRCTAAERDAIYQHAARQAALAAAHIRACADRDPGVAADAAWAAADTLHAAAQATGSRVLRRAADAYDRAGRMPYGRIPLRGAEGEGLRAAARLLALTGRLTDGMPLATATLIGSLLALTAAVAELRQAQQHAAQAAAARAAAEHLRAAAVPAAPRAPHVSKTEATRSTGRLSPARLASLDFPASPVAGRVAPYRPGAAPASPPHRRPGPPKRGGPSREP